MLAEGQEFDSSYVKTSSDQGKKNALFMPKILSSIKAYFHYNKKPLKIAEFCCGHGKTTDDFYSSITESGVPIEKMVGFDLSKELINYAQNHYKNDIISFQAINLQTQFKEQNQYDVMIIMFGLHWMNDLNSAVERVFKSLKTGGILIAGIYIENKAFYQARLQFSRLHKWEKWLSNFDLKPYRFDSKPYTQTLDKYFSCMVNEFSQQFNIQNKEYMVKAFRSFFVQTMHLIKKEINPIKGEQIAEQYLQEFVDFLPEDVGVIKRKGELFQLGIPVMYYQGKKLNE